MIYNDITKKDVGMDVTELKRQFGNIVFKRGEMIQTPNGIGRVSGFATCADVVEIDVTYVTGEKYTSIRYNQNELKALNEVK